jgi:hypothetical protein
VKAPLAGQGATIADLEKAVTGTTTPQATVDETTTTTLPPAGAALGDPFDRRLAVDGKDNPKSSYKVEDGKVLSLTDILLQNPVTSHPADVSPGRPAQPGPSWRSWGCRRGH